MRLTKEGGTEQTLDRGSECVTLFVVESDSAQRVEHVHEQQHAQTHLEGGQQLHAVQGVHVTVEGRIHEDQILRAQEIGCLVVLFTS
jgi:hypothetical protein